MPRLLRCAPRGASVALRGRRRCGLAANAPPQDLGNLAPKKVDWDLKRDIGPKLEKLERRTQRAIAEMLRDKLAAA